MSVFDALLRAVCRTLEQRLADDADGHNVDVDRHVDRAIRELAATIDVREHSARLRARAREWLVGRLADRARAAPEAKRRRR